MSTAQCACGFTELAGETLTDHLLEVFEPPDGRGNDGLVHLETSRLTCSCGLAAGTIAALDGHFLQVFTPGDRMSRDGRRHERTGAAGSA